MTRKQLLPIVLNALWFQIGWVTCVLFGTGLALVYVLLTLALYGLISPFSVKEWKLMIGIMLIGLITDVTMSLIGILDFPYESHLPPLWLITIWFAFATTIHRSLASIVKNRSLMITFSSIGGALSYFAGVRLSDVSFGFSNTASILGLALVWAVVGFVIHAAYINWLKSADSAAVANV
ncbi:MAG: DUF2878 domain-containing protein [Pseudomonadota bacterium]